MSDNGQDYTPASVGPYRMGDELKQRSRRGDCHVAFAGRISEVKSRGSRANPTTISSPVLHDSKQEARNEANGMHGSAGLVRDVRHSGTT